MEKLTYKTNINAPSVIVWHAFWNDANYRNWTSAFTEGSYAKSDWQEGSEIRFLSPKGGLYATIQKKDEPSYMAFKHIGELKDGKKMPPGDWQGSMETYTISDNNGTTELVVKLDTIADYKEYFDKTWPLALAKLKQLAEDPSTKKIKIGVTIDAPLEKVWELWTGPEHIMSWNTASPDWHTPKAENDLRVGGKFLSRMEAKDGSFGFDFTGIYDVVNNKQRIAYTMPDGRKCDTVFKNANGKTMVETAFDAEEQNSLEMQKFGWQAIANSFKKYVESK